MADAEHFLVIHALKVKGLASAEDLTVITGRTDLAPVLDKLIAAELVKLRTGRVGGYALTPAGRQSHPGLLSNHLTAAEVAGVAAAYEAFLPVNGQFKQTCTRWQMRTGSDGDQQVNDHSDPDYDAGVIGELEAVHEKAIAGLAAAVAVSARFCRYPARFDSALRRVREGDREAFARPMYASYHDIWMELHEDFLLTLGRGREKSDGH